ncbi:MAG: diguanylate cyclase [Planctomycetaceae bacterium]
MTQTTTKPVTATTYCPMAPAVPTDTCAVINRLLALSECARREVEASPHTPIVPRGVIAMLLRSMKARDPSLILHGQRIGIISHGVAELLGWDDNQRAELELAALLHDLGKIGIPDHILHKPGKLSSEEYDFLTLHHQAATSLLQSLHVDSHLISILRLLHQNFDGAGVEAKGGGLPQDLPLGPRILAVVDAYDSLSSPKSYRRGMTHEEVLKILAEQSGSRYDGNVIRTLNRWYEADGGRLFPFADAFADPPAVATMTDAESDEMLVLCQILNTLYQFQTLYDGYFILDAKQNYCVWSAGMQELSGQAAEHVIGRSWQPTDIKLAPIAQTLPDDKQSEEIVPQVFRNGRSQFSSRVCEMEDGRQISVDVYTLPVTSGPEKITGLIQLFRCKGGVRRQTREYAELKLAATRDALTGVANRGQLETQLRHLLDDFHNHEGARSLSMIFLDVDRFKSINDTHGHKAGDQVLVDLTRLLQHETYSGEVIARYGGEEFVVLCPDTDLTAAVRRAERLRNATASTSIGGIGKLKVTSSFGVATARLGDSVQTLLERADACLYRAKQTGRNRTCWENQEKDGNMLTELTTSEVDPRLSDSDGKLSFSQDIEMSTSLELTGMKLNAFIEACDVTVTEQSQGHVKLRLGRFGFTRRWGTSADRQPIEMEISFETTRDAASTHQRARTRRQVSVKIVPLGRVTSTSAFEFRCQQVMMQLKAYLQGI